MMESNLLLYNYNIYFNNHHYHCYLTGIKNPIQVACKLLDEELSGPVTSGLIPPMYAS